MHNREQEPRISALRAFQLLVSFLPCIGTSQSDFMVPPTLSLRQTFEALQLVEALNETANANIQCIKYADKVYPRR